MGTKKTTEEFVSDAKRIHRDKYDYSKTTYTTAYNKICVICHERDEFGNEHGEFWVSPHNHLSNSSGCPKCSKNHNRYDSKSFIKRASFLHDNKYDYSKSEYVDGRTKICIICPEHGEFWQSPRKHLQGQGCPKCGKKSMALKNVKGKEIFINEAKKIHPEYDYSKVEYINANTKVCIICPKHGEFWQTPHHHLNNHGCPVCQNSQLENKVRNFLNENKINFISQYRCKWLGNQSLDFYLPDIKVGIECQGEQHFKEVCYRFKGETAELREERYKKNIQRDNRKRKKCEKENVLLLYYSELKIEFPYFVFTNLENLLEKIKSIKKAKKKKRNKLCL